MKVLVGSRNPVKIGAVEDVFTAHFEAPTVVGMDVDSGVPAQPVGDETFAGAQQRALSLVRRNAEEGLGAAFCVGLEGGITLLADRWWAFGVICLADSAGRCGFGVSPLFELPPGIARSLLEGEELGHVIDRLSGDQGSKQKGGALSFLTHGRVTRRQLYAQGLTMALVPFLNPELYPSGGAPLRRTSER